MQPDRITYSTKDISLAGLDQIQTTISRLDLELMYEFHTETWQIGI